VLLLVLLLLLVPLLLQVATTACETLRQVFLPV
jgi:hypothetical protein